jgi:hypothetical protein
MYELDMLPNITLKIKIVQFRRLPKNMFKQNLYSPNTSPSIKLMSNLHKYKITLSNYKK